MKRKNCWVWTSRMSLAVGLAISGAICLPAVTGAELPEVAISPCTTAPVLDGVLDDECWKKAAVIGDFALFGSSTGERTDKTRVSICFDDQWLYFGFECLRPHPERIEQRIYQHDGSVQQDESVEIFLDPGTEGTLYLQYKLNAGNVRGEQRVTRKPGIVVRETDRDWNLPWRSATGRTEQAWVAEIALPVLALSSYGDLQHLRMNICRNGFFPQGKEMSCWSAVIRDFHDPDRFGRVKGLEVKKVGTPFLARIEQAQMGSYSVADGNYSYDVTVDIQAHTPQSGRVEVSVSDRPVSEKGESLSQGIDLAGMKRQTLRFTLPVASLQERSALVVLSDPQTGEALDTALVEGSEKLNLMSLFLDRNYYTTEKQAIVVCELGLPEEDLKKAMLRAKTSQGKVLNQTGKVSPVTHLPVPLKSLPNGDHRIEVELCRKNGALLFSQPVQLVKRPPKPGCEMKTDRIKRVVLKDGKPVFPFGIIMAALYRATDEEKEAQFREVADAGFNTAFMWSWTMLSPEAAEVREFCERAQQHGLWVVHWPELYAYPGLTDLKGKIITDPEIQKLSKAEKSKMFAEGFEKLLPKLLESVEAAKDYPNLLAHYSFDEPFGPAYFDQYLQGQELYRKTNEADGYHPTYVFYLEKEVMGWADILGTDPYWIPAGQGTKGTPNQVSLVTDLCRRKGEQFHMPVWMVPLGEYYSGCHKRILLPEEHYCQAYLLLIHGAKGWFYFRQPFAHHLTWEALRHLGKEMKVLGPIAVTPDIPQTISYSPVSFDPEKDLFPDVQVSLRANPAGGYVLLAANTRYHPVEVTYTISGLGKKGKVARLFSDPKYDVVNDSFSERLESLGTRAYLLKLPGKIETPVAISVQTKPRPELAVPEPPATPREGRPGKKNLVQNPGFEEATLPSWPDYYRPYRGKFVGTPQANWGLETTDPYQGKYCLRMESNEKRTGIGYWGTGFDFYLAPQSDRPTPYTFSMYLKADREGMQVQLPWEQKKTPVTAGEWRRYSVSGAIPPRVASYNTFRVLFWGEGTVWADAVQVEKGEKPTPFEE